MIAKNKKRIEITLSEEESILLDSLSSRFNISKSQVIKQALKVFSAKRKHFLTISYKETEETKQKPLEKPKKQSEISKNFDDILDDLDNSNPSTSTSDDRGVVS